MLRGLIRRDHIVMDRFVVPESQDRLGLVGDLDLQRNPGFFLLRLFRVFSDFHVLRGRLHRERAVRGIQIICTHVQRPGGFLQIIFRNLVGVGPEGRAGIRPQHGLERIFDSGSVEIDALEKVIRSVFDGYGIGYLFAERVIFLVGGFAFDIYLNFHGSLGFLLRILFAAFRLLRTVGSGLGAFGIGVVKDLKEPVVAGLVLSGILGLLFRRRPRAGLEGNRMRLAQIPLPVLPEEQGSVDADGSLFCFLFGNHMRILQVLIRAGTDGAAGIGDPVPGSDFHLRVFIRRAFRVHQLQVQIHLLAFLIGVLVLRLAGLLQNHGHLAQPQP